MWWFYNRCSSNGDTLFYWRKALSCYLVCWIPSPCLGTGFKGSVFCSCLNFPSIFVCTLLFYVCVFFCLVFSSTFFFVVGALMGVEWIEEGFMIFCVLFFFCFIFFWDDAGVSCYNCLWAGLFWFFLYIFCLVKGFPCLEYLFRKCPSDVVRVGEL